jgi:hypothetical protein
MKPELQHGKIIIYHVSSQGVTKWKYKVSSSKLVSSSNGKIFSVVSVSKITITIRITIIHLELCLVSISWVWWLQNSQMTI